MASILSIRTSIESPDKQLGHLFLNADALVSTNIHKMASYGKILPQVKEVKSSLVLKWSGTKDITIDFNMDDSPK